MGKRYETNAMGQNPLKYICKMAIHITGNVFFVYTYFKWYKMVIIMVRILWSFKNGITWYNIL